MSNPIADALKRFSDALQHARNSWMPVQDEVLVHLKEGLSQSYYEANPDELLDDLKTDPAIFAGILRVLSTNASSQRPSIVEHCGVLSFELAEESHPIDLLLQAPQAQIQGALQNTQQLSSKHSFADMELFQARVLEHVTVSTLAAETLAFAAGIDPEMAFCASLLRSLGHSLSAWNFPKEYETALLRLPSDQPFEARLRQTLGFTPEALSGTLILDWGLNRELLQAVRQSPTATPCTPIQELHWRLDEDTDLTTKLITIVETSQKLADIVHIEHKANAIVFWPKLQELFTTHLGEYGLQLVLEQAREKLLRCSPHPISLPMPPVLTVMAQRIETLEKRYAALAENTHLKDMPTEAQRRIEQFYRTYNAGAKKQQEVLQLIEQVAPLLGIAEFGVFEKDSGSESATPLLWYSQMGNSGPRKIILRNHFGPLRPVVTSFHIKTLVRDKDVKDSTIEHVALPLGMRTLGKEFTRVASFRSISGFFRDDSTSLSEFARGLVRLMEDYGYSSNEY